MDENSDLPEVLAPSAQQSLNSAKMFLIRAVEGLLTDARHSQAKQLIDAITVVENVLADKSIISMSAHDKRFTHEEIQMMIQGRKIDAIRTVRARCGLGLREAKDLVESFTLPAPEADVSGYFKP